MNRDLKLDLHGDDVRALQDALEILGESVADAERQHSQFGQSTHDAVVRFQRANQLNPTGIVDAATAQAITAAVVASAYVVAGTVTSPDRAGVGGLRVVIVDRNVGEDVSLASTTTQRTGQFRVRFGPKQLAARQKSRPDLQARVFAGKTLLAASKVAYNASRSSRLDVLLPANATALPTEHETLTADLAPVARRNLAELQETTDRPDITYLANKTGWDARAIALAALADRFARADGGQLDPSLYYALFRAGLPASESLYRTAGTTVRTIWTLAAAQGVIPPAAVADLAGAITRFQALAAKHTLDAPSPAGTSSMREMLRVSLGEDPQRQARFAELEAAHRGDPAGLWEAAEKTFGAATTARLKLDGQLGYLTADNAPLIARLQSSPLGSVRELVARGFHRPAAWTAIVDGTVPRHIPGNTDAERRQRYAEVLAAQVRVAFPTAVVEDGVRSGALALTSDGAVRDEVVAFLGAHDGAFEIGMHPIEQYLARARPGSPPSAPAIGEIKRLQRVYQISPNDHAMEVLLRKNLDSAYRIARYDRRAFVRQHGADLGGASHAEAIHLRSQQVYNAVLNIATGYVLDRRAPANDKLISNSNSSGGNGDSSAANVLSYPTLESLLGSMDYCACEACRSILSPAAYLVDLLQFLDVEPPDSTTEKPLDVVLDRRPDLATLPLTCENTNTALPYIDLVNETLEYFVLHASMSGYTGHDTDDAVSSAELLAAPQFTDASAYTALETAIFPPPLPFSRSLEALRRTFGTFEAPLHRSMETLRVDDAAGTWRDILIERAGVSPQEHDAMTTGSLTLQALYGFAPAATLDEVTAQIRNLQNLTRRLQISYDDVVALLRSQFINPDAALIPLLDDLGITFSTIKAVNDGTLDPAQLQAYGELIAQVDAADYDGDVTAWLKSHYAAIMGLITIANPTHPSDLCSLEELELRYGNPVADNTLRSFEFVKLIRFVRLWKKLGWPIEQIDQTITALMPPVSITGDDATDLASLDAGFEILLVRLGLVFELIEQLHLNVGRDLAGLLACFAPIGTYGDTALYTRLFLNPAVLQLDAAFDQDAHGSVPAGAGQPLLDHTEALRAACNLTDAELTLIITALGYDAPPDPAVPTPLGLDTITQIFRRGWLARKLHISVAELLLLIGSTGLDPFALPDPPLPPIVELLELVQHLVEARLRPTEALYRIWNQDISGQSAPAQDEISEVARSLRAALAAVDVEFAAADDPTGEIARARMALVYGSDTADFYAGLLTGTYATALAYARPEPLDDTVIAAGGSALVYDDFRKQLVWLGVMTPSNRDTAVTAATGLGDSGLVTALDLLFAANQAAVSQFFARYPTLQAPLDAFLASPDPLSSRWNALLATLLPDLIAGRKRQQALSVVSAAADTNVTLAQTVLDDARVLHAAASSTASAVDDLVALQTASAAGITATWAGFLEAPESSDLNLTIVTDAGATVSLVLDGEPLALLAGSPGTWSTQQELAVSEGTLHAISIQVTPPASPVVLRWSTPTRGWEDVPPQYVYAQPAVDALRRAYLTYLKASALAASLHLTPAEIAHLAADPLRAIDAAPWLDALPVTGTAEPATAASLTNALTAMLDYASLKARFAPDDERVLDVLEDPQAVLDSGDDALLALTGWNATSLDALLSRFGLARAALSDVVALRKVADAYALVTATGLSGEALIAASTNHPDDSVVAALQSAVRARYDESDWLEVIKPVNDQMRALQRDALVAHILAQFAISTDPHQQTIDTGDKLFEYFLMDVLMDPCMQTSRVRHALSSVQLFVERCSMNLEPRVATESINADWWKWMKRYRVWEANRKVFLWPENWLEPELRDDTSQFYDEVMGELLQSDITDDAALSAVQRYLVKLEEIARLEPCGVYQEERDSGDADDVIHVIACTYGTNRKYYYRRKECLAWTPWETVKLDIEDRPVVPVVWNDRLFLFWLRLVKTSPDPASAPNTPPASSGDEDSLANTKPSALKTAAEADAAAQSAPVSALLCYSEYRDNKWTPTKTSDKDQPLPLGTYPVLGSGAFDRRQLVLNVAFLGESDDDDTQLFVRVTGPGVPTMAWFRLYNTHSNPEINPPIYPIDLFTYDRRTLNTTDSDTFSITYVRHTYDFTTSDSETKTLDRSLLDTELADDLTVDPRQPLDDVWDAPFFYRDKRHVFYVTTVEKVVTLRDSNFYGPGAWNDAASIPSLVFPIDRYKAGFDPGAPVEAGESMAVRNPGMMTKFVTEDAYVHTGLAAGGTVQFDGAQVGPSGAMGEINE